MASPQLKDCHFNFPRRRVLCSEPSTTCRRCHHSGRGFSPSVFLGEEDGVCPEAEPPAGERLVVAPPGPSWGTVCQPPTKLFVTGRIAEPLPGQLKDRAARRGSRPGLGDAGVGVESREIASPSLRGANDCRCGSSHPPP